MQRFVAYKSDSDGSLFQSFALQNSYGRLMGNFPVTRRQALLVTCLVIQTLACVGETICQLKLIEPENGNFSFKFLH